MSETTEKAPLSSDQKKAIALGGLLVVLIAVVAWQYSMGGSDTPAQAPKADDGRVPNSKVAAQEQPKGDGKQKPLPNEPVFGPIEVLNTSLIDQPVATTRVNRNIFSYPPPPIPPKPKARPIVTPDPVPLNTIALGSVQPQSAIAGTSRTIDLALAGRLFPVDAQVYWDGTPVPTQFVSPNFLRATIDPARIANPRTVAVEVRSKSQPEKLWSNQMQFQLNPSPDPGGTMTYAGRIGSQAVVTFKDGKRQLVSAGDTINTNLPWKVLAVRDNELELLDTRNEIKKRLNIVPKSKN